MPFHTSFNPEYDIIYGIGAWITKYILNYTSGGKTCYGESDNPSDLEWKEAQRLKEEDYYAVNTFNTVLEPKNFKKTGSVIKVSGVEQTRYMTAMNQNPKLKLDASGGDLSTLMPKLQKSNARLTKVSDERDILAAAKDLAIRRSSKFGIEYIVNNVEGTVHYVLDGINQDILLNKTPVTNKSGYTKTPICTSELRYLFRNWERLGPTNRVVFWKGYEVTQAPWETPSEKHLAGWAAYACDRLVKYSEANNHALPPIVRTYIKDRGIKLGQLKANLEKIFEGSGRASNGTSFLVGRNVTSAEVIKAFHGIQSKISTSQEQSEHN